MPPVEIVAGTLYAVGANVLLDDRVSWAPATGDYQPMNCYAFVDPESPLIIDPGPAVVESAVVEGLASLIPADRRTPVFLTRFQFDGIGNLGALAERLTLGTVYSGGSTNPFDAFDQVTSADTESRAGELSVARVGAGTFAVSDTRTIEIFEPFLRVLVTYWAYDAETRTLFTSDTFTHVTVEAESSGRVLDSPAHDRTTVDDVRAHLFATFDWLPSAHTRPIVEQLERIFHERHVEVIAPDRGCILQGKEIVERHVAMVVQVLSEVRLA
jgi:flavorubredoxin